ncbi:MAG TPA: PAS domain-containing protein [Azospirillum sp.]|nr:PAS domain-containing protein [Azospirillum sp.]
MLLFGALVTLCLSAVELYLEYRYGLAVIEHRLDEIEASHAAAAADRLRAVDPLGVELLARGIASLPAIRYVDIREVGTPWGHSPPVVVGERVRSNSLGRTIPLVRDREGKDIIGELQVEATLDELYAHLVRRGGFILGEQVMKSLLLASFFLLVVHRLVAARIASLSTRLMAFGGVSGDIVLPESGVDGDEIDHMLFAFDAMKDGIALRESELRRAIEFSEGVIRAMPDLLFKVDRQGTYLKIWARQPELLAAPPDMILGRAIPDILPAEAADIAMSCIREADESGLSVGKIIRLDLPHGVAWFELSCTRMGGHDGEEPHFLTVSHNITKLKQDEEKLKAREQEYRALAENSPDVIVRYDRDCRRVYANPAYEKATGLAVSKVPGTNPGEGWGASIPVEDYRALIRGVMESGSPVRARMVWRKPGSSQDFIHDVHMIPEYGQQNEVRGVLAIGRDVTKLVEAERQFHSLVENLPDDIMRLDRDLRILFANGPLLTRLGGRLEEVLGKTLAEVGEGHRVDVLTEAARRAVAEGRPNVTEIVFDEIAPAVVMEIRHVPEFDHEGHVTSVLRIGRDISERKAHEEIEHQLMKAQRFEALGLLAGNIAHDFNNLLGAILGFAGLIVGETPPDDPSHQLAARIAAAGEHGKTLVSQILTFARRTDLRFGRVPLSSALEDVKSLLAGAIPATTRLVVTAEKDVGSVLGDRGQIVHLLVNLCINAHHAFKGGHGEISLAAHRAPRDCESVRRLYHRKGNPATDAVESWRDSDGKAYAVAGHLSPDRQYHVLRIADTGCGMDDTLLGQAFTPFFTTKGPGHGTGLGLSTVHGTVLAHGGALAVESRPGEGTCFEVFLPAAAGYGAFPEEEPESGSNSQPQVAIGGRVLLVDDDPHFCDMLLAVLESRGFEVAPCSDPREALDAIVEFGCTWDVLITDQTMPHMTGLELVRAVRERCPTLPCILCTGFSEEDLGDDVLRAAGVFALMRKPLDLGAFTHALAQALASRDGGSCAARPV